MDINLSGKMNGIETADVIKAIIQYHSIFVTAYSDENTIVKSKTQ
jgi:DNA-binding NarL/FixJ family response regulator